MACTSTGDAIETPLLILTVFIAWALYKYVRGQPWGKPEDEE